MRIGICGAGVAGPTLAFWLQRAGHEITLIEEAPSFRSGGYVIDFWGVGYTVAERMGLIPQILKRGYRVQEVRLVNDAGERVGGFPVSAFTRLTHDHYTSLPRGDLAEIIYNAVKDKVETLFGETAATIEETGDEVKVTLEGGATRSFDIFVGADGLHSRVRQLLWGAEKNFERPLGYYVAAIKAKDYPRRDENVYLTFAAPGRSLSRFSMRNDETLFLFVFTADQMPGAEPHDEAGRRAVLRAVFGASGWEASEILKVVDALPGEIYFDRVSQIEMPRWHKGRTILIGDAAGCVSLLAGEGTGIAMTEAYVLAGELARAGMDVQAAFSAYEARLRPFVLGKQKSARAFASSFAPKTELGVWLQREISRLLIIPPVADLVIGPSLKDDIDLPDFGAVS